ncbi:Cupin domain-containing protein [Paenibacillus sp. UNC496MF]|uniref:AraC family transcriptional regulator n=1 Tax=Paenibacillus sp. UNC496MF TaxID=1502753 RepID=UPI0008EC50E6|nr:AraC family transcriptional regulator [Paenibacillus sp. UNC496MF]SFJ51244.1 Cupin domain-containing protein [Paenibacillus sp. UNC496MF]
MDFARFHPYVYYATRYAFYPGQASLNRHCYSASIYFVTEGRGIFRLDGREYEALPGMLVYAEAGRRHDWASSRDAPMTHACCYFDWRYVDRTAAFPDAAGPIAYEAASLRRELVGEPFPHSMPNVMQVGASLRGWIELLQPCYTPNEHTTERTFIRSLSAQSRFMRFIDQFLNYALHENDIPDPRVTKLLARIEEDLLNGLRVPPETYAEGLGLSRGYFFELFKRTTGASPIHYMNRFLVNRAKDDLRSSNLTVAQIAEKYGFSSVHYFSRLFRRHAGKSPQAFRQER